MSQEQVSLKIVYGRIIDQITIKQNRIRQLENDIAENRKALALALSNCKCDPKEAYEEDSDYHTAQKTIIDILKTEIAMLNRLIEGVKL